MGRPWFFLILFLSFPIGLLSKETVKATVVVYGAEAVAETDENFVCATIDWWHPSKCGNQCPFGLSYVLNLDTNHPHLVKAIRAFDPLRIRIGGSLQDQVIYGVGNSSVSPCLEFQESETGLFGFSQGCLSMNRWDELNSLFNKTGAIVTFGLNALHGRRQIGGQEWVGAWNSSNARSFIEYTISRGHRIDSWEFGNELCGTGIGARVGAKQYGEDVIALKAMLDDLYVNYTNKKPSVVAPGGFFDQQWYGELLRVSGPSVVGAISHHIYNLGAGVDPSVIDRILDPSHLGRIAETFRDVQLTVQRNGPWASAWVSEAGGAYNGGSRLFSGTFVDSFWYLDQLGMASIFNTKVYCRQTLVGGVTLLFINLSNTTAFDIKIQPNSTVQTKSPMYELKRMVKWVGKRALNNGWTSKQKKLVGEETSKREEYHLTPKDGQLRTQTMLLNGSPLELTLDGDIPALDPVLVSEGAPLVIPGRASRTVNRPRSPWMSIPLLLSAIANQIAPATKAALDQHQDAYKD
ncbi:Heparanase-like protein 1 [Acorus calamus]|uniref:Heparanase-like protein 1 n=1 Tax=Acorus calamus TaxID=4465 RepID=A0AAV9EKP5_ACOCL|nr:Heparanase-like protein 1 [Acorus calamus]